MSLTKRGQLNMDKEHSTENTSTYCDSIPEIWEWMTAEQKKKVVEMGLE